MTVIRKFDTFDSTEIKFRIPEEVKELINIELPSEIQAPVFENVEDLEFSDTELHYSYFKLCSSSSNNFQEWMTQFDDHVISYLHDNSENIWGKERSQESLSSIYSSSVSSKDTMKLHLSRSKKETCVRLRVVDKDNKKITGIDRFEQDTRMVGIIRCNTISVNNDSINAQWDLRTITLKPKKQSKPRSCIIVDDTDSEDDFFY